MPWGLLLGVSRGCRCGWELVVGVSRGWRRVLGIGDEGIVWVALCH